MTRSRADVRRRRLVLRALDRASDVAGVALDAGGANEASVRSTAALLRFVRDLERRGVVALVVGAPADLLTELAMERGPSPLLAVDDVSAALALLRRFDELASRALDTSGCTLAAIRVPARPESVALVCRGLGELLESYGVDASRRESLTGTVRDIVHDEVLPACDPSSNRLAVSAAAQGDRVTVTILDDGAGSRAAGAIGAGLAGVRIHRFRVLGRHHAIVVEQEPGRPVALP